MPSIRCLIATTLLLLAAACAQTPPAGDATPPTPVGAEGDI